MSDTAIAIAIGLYAVWIGGIAVSLYLQMTDRQGVTALTGPVVMIIVSNIVVFAILAYAAAAAAGWV